jgi:hypothetical protein
LLNNRGVATPLVAIALVAMIAAVGLSAFYYGASTTSRISTSTLTSTVDQTTTQTATITSINSITTTETFATSAGNTGITTIDEAYLSHLLDFESHNATAIADDYEENATVNLIGCTFGLGGMQTGRPDIQLFFNAFFGPASFGTPDISKDSYTVSANQTTAIVNSTFEMKGNTTMSSYPAFSLYSTNVVLHTSYKQVGSQWIITDEVWNFTSTQIAGQPYCI